MWHQESVEQLKYISWLADPRIVRSPVNIWQDDSFNHANFPHDVAHQAYSMPTHSHTQSDCQSRCCWHLSMGILRLIWKYISNRSFMLSTTSHTTCWDADGEEEDGRRKNSYRFISQRLISRKPKRKSSEHHNWTLFSSSTFPSPCIDTNGTCGIAHTTFIRYELVNIIRH